MVGVVSFLRQQSRRVVDPAAGDDRQRLEPRRLPAPTAARDFPGRSAPPITVNGADSPIFVDPAENVVTVQANTVELIGSERGGHDRDRARSGQVYAGIVNGTVWHRRLRRRRTRISPIIRSISQSGRRRIGLAATTATSSSATSASAAAGSLHRLPRLLTAYGQPGANQLAVSWNASAGASHYMVERSHERRELVGRRSFGDDHVLCRFRSRVLDDLQLLRRCCRRRAARRRRARS